MGRSPPPPKRGRSHGPGVEHGGIAKRTDRPVSPPRGDAASAVRRYAERLRVLREHSGIPLRHVDILFGHGVIPENIVANEFIIPPRTAIVFLSPVGMTLPQEIIDEKFYKLFTNSKRISDLLAGRLPSDSISPYFHDWKRRIYGPGDRCPNMEIDTTDDPCWNGMGRHALPLSGPLRDHRTFAPCLEVRQHDENPLRRGVAIFDETYFEKWTHRRVLASHGTGSPKIQVKDISFGPEGGVLFVIACRGLASRRSMHDAVLASVRHLTSQTPPAPRSSLHIDAIQKHNRDTALHAKRRQRAERNIEENRTRHYASPGYRPVFPEGTEERRAQERYEIPFGHNENGHETVRLKQLHDKALRASTREKRVFSRWHRLRYPE